MVDYSLDEIDETSIDATQASKGRVLRFDQEFEFFPSVNAQTCQKAEERRDGAFQSLEFCSFLRSDMSLVLGDALL